MCELRTIEIRENEQWAKVNCSDLKKGDTFRMFEPTGEPVLGIDGQTSFVASSDAYIDVKFKQWVVQIK